MGRVCVRQLMSTSPERLNPQPPVVWNLFLFSGRLCSGAATCIKTWDCRKPGKSEQGQGQCRSRKGWESGAFDMAAAEFQDRNSFEEMLLIISAGN